MADLNAFREELYGKGYQVASFRQSAMVGTSLPWAGIPTPHLKEVVKAHFGDARLLNEDWPLDESVELTVAYFWLSLHALPDFSSQLAFLDERLAYAQSWMITDVLSQQFKKDTSAVLLPYYRKWAKSSAEYAKRFAYVAALRYYREKDITPFLKALRNDSSYYVTMGQAWMLATFAITHWEEILVFIQTADISMVLKKKTVSKILDSYRISPEKKAAAKEIRQHF